MPNEPRVHLEEFQQQPSESRDRGLLDVRDREMLCFHEALPDDLHRRRVRDEVLELAARRFEEARFGELGLVVGVEDLLVDSPEGFLPGAKHGEIVASYEWHRDNIIPPEEEEPILLVSEEDRSPRRDDRLLTT